MRIPLEVEFQVQDQQYCKPATLVDLSAGGVALLTEDPLPTGGLLAHVRFRLGKPGESDVPEIVAATEVVRCTEQKGVGRQTEYLVGAKFLDLDNEKLQVLHNFIDQQLGEIEGGEPPPRLECEQPIAIQYQRFDDFVSEVATNLSRSGMFIRVKKPEPPGSVLDFSFRLGDDFSLIEGKAEVVWTRPLPDGPDRPPGMGVKFIELDDVSEKVLEQILQKQLEDGSAESDSEAGLKLAQRIQELEAERDMLSATLDDERTLHREEQERLILHAKAERESFERELDDAAERHVERAVRAKEAVREEMAAEGQRLAEQLNKVESEREGLLSEHSAVLEERESLEKKLETSERLLEERLGEVKGNDERVAELETALREAEQAIEDHRQALETARSNGESAAEELAEKLRSEEERCLGLKGELEREQETHTELSRQNSDLQASLEELQDRAAHAAEATGKELSASVRELETLRGELEAAKAETATVRNELESAATEAETTRAEIESVLTELEAAREEDERRRVEFDEAGARFEASHEADAELIARLEAELDGLQSEETRLREETLKTGEQNQELAERVEALTQEVESLRSEAAEVEHRLREELASLEATSKETADSSQQAVDSLEHALEETGEQLAVHRQAESELRSQLNAAKSEIELQAQQVQELEANATANRQALQAARGEIDELRIGNEAVGALEEQLASAKKDKTALRGELASLAKVADEAEARKEEVEGQLDEAAVETERLSRTNEELARSLRMSIGDPQLYEQELLRSSQPTGDSGVTRKPPAARPGALRAAAFVGFGLVLGFLASYPFETILASSEPLTIRGFQPIHRTASTAEAAAPEPETPAEVIASLEQPALEPVTEVVDPTEPAPARPSPERAVNSWARAWSDQRVADYLDAYSTRFETPEGLERGVWELQRTRRIQKPSSIDVTVGIIEIEDYAADSVRLTFNQSYVAESYSDRVRKTLELVWEEDAWRIARETSEPIDSATAG